MKSKEKIDWRALIVAAGADPRICVTRGKKTQRARPMSRARTPEPAGVPIVDSLYLMSVPDAPHTTTKVEPTDGDGTPPQET